MLRSPRSAMLFVAFFALTAMVVTPVAPVNVPFVCAVATGLLRGHIWEEKVLHNNEGAGRCRVWRARATSVLLVAISGRRLGRRRLGASPALCGQGPQIDQKALPNNRALQKSFSDFQARRRALTGRGSAPTKRGCTQGTSRYVLGRKSLLAPPSRSPVARQTIQAVWNKILLGSHLYNPFRRKRQCTYLPHFPTVLFQTKGRSHALKPLPATHVQAHQRRTPSHPMPNVPL